MTRETSASSILLNAAAHTDGRVELFRCNAGRFRSLYGQQIIEGFPTGFPDYLGYVTRDGIAVCTAIETKATNGRLTDEQKRWRFKLESDGVIYRIARPEDAAEIIRGLR